MTQKALEAVEMKDVIQVEEGKKYIVVLSYNPDLMEDVEGLDEWIRRMTQQLKEVLTSWLKDDPDPFLVIGMPEGLLVTFQRVEEDEDEAT